MLPRGKQSQNGNGWHYFKINCCLTGENQISYFADYEMHPEESFVFWKNTGDLNFQGYSFGEVNAGRWLTMAAGDMDLDGDTDLVLGNANFAMGKIPKHLKESWNQTAPSVMTLRNIGPADSKTR